MVDRRPRLIARCTGSADVAAAVRFARDRDLEIAVWGGGHNGAGTAVCDDGIVIDLSTMRAVSVDAAARTAQVQGGALWGDVDHETQAYGLATTGGIVGHTGVGGVSLGGGIGWLMRKQGLTVDNLVEAEVVTGLLKREPGVVGGPAEPHDVPVDLAVERQVRWRQRAARRPAGRQVPAQLVGVGAFGEPPVLPRIDDPVAVGLVHPRRVRAR